MSINFNIDTLLNKSGLSKTEIQGLSQLFQFVQYLFDDEGNLTKTFNLNKKAKDLLNGRVEELFEYNVRKD
ncbi:hypothetical protein [Candidatus Lokiarchaeum ossiferum]|uniref:hypothetical protein n=1 Tax=Candidatus Lokiarchaeum ossiferum TaxID=2951803 RepID=UPI00352E8E60